MSTAGAFVRTVSTTHRLAGGLMIVGSAIGYGLLALFATQARNAGLSEVAVMAFRFAIAAVVLWLIVAVRRPAIPSWPTLAAAFVLGGLCWSIQSVAYLTAVTRVGASLASLLLYTYPLIVIAVAVVNGRQVWNARLSMTGGLVLVGLALVFGVGLAVTGLDPLGVGAGLVAAVSYTTFILVGEPLSARVDPFLFTALAMTGAAFATGFVTAAQGGVHLSPVIQAGASLLGLALLSTVAPGLAFLFGLRRVGSSTAAILSCTEVVVTCTVAWATLGDRLTPVQLTGCAAIVIAVVICGKERRVGGTSAGYAAGGEDCVTSGTVQTERINVRLAG